MRHPWTVRALFNTDTTYAGADPKTVLGQFVETGLVMLTVVVALGFEVNVLVGTLLA